jgi:putative inorganic carbon (hco3(-)) transporter
VLFTYLALYYIRPTEWVPGLIGTPLLWVSGVISLLLLGIGALARRFPNILAGDSERMMLGFAAAIAMSHLKHYYFGGAVNSLNIFLPTVTGFFLVVCLVDNRQRLYLFLLLLIILTTYLAYEGWLQHVTGFSDGGLQPLYENHISADGESAQLSRIRWYGVFNDPNDLGLALVLVIPFLLDKLLQRRSILSVVALPLIAVAIYYTNSRGTVLAGLVAICSYIVIRCRSLYGALAGGLFGVIIFLLGPSRMASVSASEESAYGRIEAWYAAYQMFKENPLFGVGHGMFIDFHKLTAHNSFVLVMAELGIVGLFFFTGLFYFPYHWLWIRIFGAEAIALAREDVGLVSAAYGSLTGMLAAMFFLSRSYILLPFMVVALVVALNRILDADGEVTAGRSLGKPQHFRNITALTVMQIVGINILVKVFI